MQLPVAVTASLTFSLLLFSLIPSATYGHNITKILAKHPEFSQFNHYLTLTHLAAEINRRQTITVCAVDNDAMSGLLSQGYSLYTIKNVLSLHVFADYFGTKKLHQITKGSTLTATMFQATGKADGMSGYVNITDTKGGKVAFGAVDNGGVLSATYVKSVQELPYNISVIHISHILNSVEAEAPTAAPSQLNLTTLMAKQGCKAFSDLVIGSGASKTFHESLDGGLTVFCPSDGAIKAFMPKYNNLTKTGQTSIVLYHGTPVYNSMQTLKANNGLMSTLATDGADNYGLTVQTAGEDITLKTGVITTTVTATLVDEEPVILYKIDKVLQPKELFKASPGPKAPKGSADAPEPASDDDVTAADSEKSGAVRFSGKGVVVAALGMFFGVLMVLN